MPGPADHFCAHLRPEWGTSLPKMRLRFLYRARPHSGFPEISLLRGASRRMRGSYKARGRHNERSGMARGGTAMAGGPKNSGRRDRDLGRLTTVFVRSEEHTSELQSQSNLVC